MQYLNKNSFISFAKCYYYLELYNKGKISDEMMSGLDDMLFFYNTNIMPLPSGNIGNILALSLEMNLYKSAYYILRKKELFCIDLASISYNTNNFTSYSFDDVLNYSLKSKEDLTKCKKKNLKKEIDENNKYCKIILNNSNFKKSS